MPVNTNVHHGEIGEGGLTGDDWRFGADEPISIRVEPRLRVNTADAAIMACKNGLGVTRTLSYQVYDAAAARPVPSGDAAVAHSEIALITADEGCSNS